MRPGFGLQQEEILLLYFVLGLGSTWPGHHELFLYLVISEPAAHEALEYFAFARVVSNSYSINPFNLDGFASAVAELPNQYLYSSAYIGQGCPEHAIIPTLGITGLASNKVCSVACQ